MANVEITAITPETHWKNIPELQELESIGKQNLAEFEKKVTHGEDRHDESEGVA